MKEKYLIITFLLVLVGSTSLLAQKNSLEKTQRFKIEKELSDQIFSEREIEFTPGVPFGKKAAMSDSYGDVPGVNWARQFGGSASDYARKVVSDNNGNAYVTGYFNGTISTGEGEYSASGYRDGFVAKYNSSGTLVWFKPLPAEQDMKVYSFAISLDASGNILITGYFTGDLTFGSSNRSEEEDYNAFIAKLSPDGELLFAREYGNSTTPEIGIAIESDDQDNIFILGKQSTNMSSRNPSFILKLDANGNLIWEQLHDEGFNDFSVTSSGIYFTGSIESAADGNLDQNVSVSVPAKYEDIFVAKSDLNGDFLWGKTLEHEGEAGYIYSNSPLLATDNNENIYLTGYFINNLRLGEFILEKSQSVFIAKLNAAGEFQWASLLYGNPYIVPSDVTILNNTDIYFLYDNVIFQVDQNASLKNERICNGIINGLAANNGSNELYSVGSFNSNIVFNVYDNSINHTAETNFDGDAGTGTVYAMASDHSGNIYVYGGARNCDYYDTEIESGTFFAKHQANGELLWIKEFPGAHGQSSSMGDYVYVDKKNDFVYLTGSLTGDLVIPGVSRLTAGDQDAFFLLKYDLEGNLISTIKEDIPLEEPAVVADEEGQVIITGHFSEEFQFKGQLYNMSGHEKNGFMIKYNENMEYRWSKHLKGNYVDYFYIQAVDEDNNIYLTGEVYSDTLMIANHEMILPEYEGNIILVKMKANGELLWAKTTAQAYNNKSYWSNWPTGIKISTDGYLYMKGWHGDSVYFDNIMLTIPNDYRYSYFIAKFDLYGNVIWAKSISEETRGFDYNQFDLDNDGNVYFGGHAAGDLQFGNDFYFDNDNSRDLFVAKYNSDGELDWVQTMDGQGSSYNWISSVAVGGEDDVFVSGFFADRLEFGGVELNTHISRHGFIARLSDAVGVPVYTRPVGNFTISPNPSDGRIKIKGEKIEGNNMLVLNALGQQVYSFKMDQNEKNFDLTWLSSGLYFVQVVGNHEFRANKFIIE